MNPRYPQVAARAGQRCEYCRAPEQVFNFAFEVEHIHPRSQGGDDAPGNLALACESCNLYKADSVSARDGLTDADVRLFHPRQDLWEEHFLFDQKSMQVQGRTPSGRATVARLRMNSAFQIRARRQWALLGLYP